VTFQEFATSRLPALLAFAAVLTGERATAEDIAQEVLIRAYARWNTIGGLDRPEFYVRKMVLNEFLSWRRRSWRVLAKPIKPGQRPPACHEIPPTYGQGQVSTKLEEFSAATGRAIRVVYRSPSPTSIATFDVFWSNASGSVLVLDAPTKPGFHSPGVLGVLSGGKFTPIPTAPSPFTSLIAF